MDDMISCSILQNVKVPRMPLLIFQRLEVGLLPESAKLGALDTPQSITVWSPHLLRSGSAGHGAMCGLHSQQTVVLSFPTVPCVKQPRAVEAEVCGIFPFLE